MIGSIRALTDERGNVTDRFSFTAFGGLHDHSGEDSNAYLFAGEQLDSDSGFYYNRARWMDPRSGRFCSRDEYPGTPRNPITFAPYLYAAGNPV